MEELLRTNDLVLISFVEALLGDAGIATLTVDQNMSVIEGSLGVLPRRVLVPGDRLDEARAVLKEAGIGGELSEPKGKGGVTAADPESPPAPAEVSVDAFLGGRVEAVQPQKGHHRAGLEAVLLAASLDARIEGTVVDLGAGAGVAGLCAAARCRHARVVLVERDPEAIACARAALERPANAAFADRVRIVSADISGPEADRSEAGIGRGLADHVIVNPPFHAAGAGTASPKIARAGAHVLGQGGLDPWFRAAASVLKFGGDLTIVFRADGLEALLQAAARRFGGLDLLPVLPRAEEPAHRMLVRGVKGSRAALRILPPLVLHGAEGNGFTAGVEAMLRDGRALSSVVRAWHGGRSRPS